MAKNIDAQVDPVAGPPAPKQTKKDKERVNPMWDILDREAVRTQTAAGQPDEIAAEVSKYLRRTNEPRKSDCLKWWRETGAHVYPNIWTVARKFLAIPGSSVPSG